MRRLAKPQDLEAVFSIYSHASVVPFLTYEPMSLDAFRPIFRELVDSGCFFVWEIEGVIAGFYKATRYPGRVQHVALLGTLAVDPGRHGQGVGRAMVVDAIERLQADGVRRIELYAEGDNAQALRFYEKLGFEREGTLRDFYKRAHESHYVDEHVMALQVVPRAGGARVDGGATLHLVCGKIGAGKSTLTQRLASAPATVLISEDTWLAALYPGEIRALADYVRCAQRLKSAMAGHVQALLAARTSVVLDFPCNTVINRQWARGVFESAGAPHQLHFLDVPDEVCKARLRARNAAGEHPFQTTDAEFDQITSHFVAPTDAEGFNVVRHG